MTLEALWLEVRTHLQKKKSEINDEIINYPPPIPACDVQFNHLLEERTRITQELNRARETSDHEGNFSDSIRTLREFIDSCDYIDDELAATWELKAAQLAKHS